MPNPHSLVTHHTLASVAFVTTQPSDYQYLSTWSKPNVPLLIYSGSADPWYSTHIHRYNGGTLAGAEGGHPVQLIYWGDWWATPPGVARQNLITPATQRLLASNYFSQMVQYGIPHAPVWRDALVCTEPVAPVRLDPTSLSQRVVKLIQMLIDDAHLPDPDEGARICYVVCMPDSFTVTGPFAGAHRSYDKDFPFEGDRFWGGWVQAEPADPMQTMVTITHEIAEILVDPEMNGWRWSNVGPGGWLIAASDPRTEFCDGSEGQTAIVNDVRVQAYWSNAHNAPIIPIDNDYGAQLRVHVRETDRSAVDSGPFIPSNANCPDFPECCFNESAFRWHTFHMQEEAWIRINVQRFQAPAASWSVNGQPITANGPISLTVDLETYAGLTATITSTPISVDVRVLNNPPRLHLRPINVPGNFELTVSSAVSDSAITGSPVVNVVATPHVQVGFRGEETLIDDLYYEQLGHCHAAMLRQYTEQYKPTGVPAPQEGINWISEIVAQGLPAYVRPSQYARIRELTLVARATNALFGREAAEERLKQVMDAVPVLGAIARRSGAAVPTSAEVNSA